MDIITLYQTLCQFSILFIWFAQLEQNNAGLFDKTLLFHSMDGVDDFSSKWNQMSSQASLNAETQIAPLRTEQGITFTQNTVSQGDIESNIIITDPNYKVYAFRFNFISPGQDVTIKPSSTAANDPQFTASRWLEPRVDWKASPPSTTFVWYADNYDNYFCCAASLGLPVIWNWFIIQYGWGNSNSQITYLNNTASNYLAGKSLSPVGVGVYHQYKLTVDFAKEKVTYYSPMGDIVNFQMKPGQVSGAPFCTFGLFSGINQATFRNITVDNDLNSATGARFRLQFQDPAFENLIILDQEVNFQVSPSIWVNYVQEFTPSDFPKLQNYNFQILIQDAGDSTLQSAPYFGDFFVSHLQVEASAEPFLHQATDIQDIFVTENGPSYSGMVGPVEIDLTLKKITAPTTSTGYLDEMIGKNGKFPNDACGSISDDQLNGNSAVNYLYGDEGNDQLYGLDGNDFLFGGPGDDLIQGGLGADQIDGNQGLDSISYVKSLGPVMISLTEGKGWGFEAQGDIISNIERVIGSDFNDILIGNQGENFFQSGAGDDVIAPIGNGFLNSDTITSGLGQDVVIITCSNSETILKDFDVLNDKIDIRAMNKIRFNSDLIFQSISSTETLLFIQNDYSITAKIYFEGVSRNLITNFNFIFLPLTNGSYSDCSSQGVYQYLLNGHCLFSCPCNYQISNLICVPICDILCLQCSSVDFACYECQPGYILEPSLGVCLKRQRQIQIPIIVQPWEEPNDEDDPSTSDSGASGETSSLICDQSCVQCFGPEKNQCLICQPNLIFDRGYCQDCSDSLNQHLKVCNGCDLEGCDQCDGELNKVQCLRCQPGQAIINGVCVLQDKNAIIFPKNQDVRWVISVFYVTIAIHFFMLLWAFFQT